MFQVIRDKDNCYYNSVDGSWKPSRTGKTIKIFSPIDGQFIGMVPSMTTEEVDEVMASAKAAQKTWKETPLIERAKVLNQAAFLLREHKEEIAKVLVREIAKDIKSSIAEVERTADFLLFTADAAKQMKGEMLQADAFPGYGTNKMSFISREPLGTVLAISPFNYPVNLSTSKIAPALVGGNTVVLKPPTQGSISTLHLVRIFEMAGVPKGVLNTVTGRGSEIGDYVVTHKDVDFINFTGSTEIGQHLASISTMKPLLMELGGKDAAIVLDDADLDWAASNIVSGAFSYSGQRCTAVKRVLVDEKVGDTLVEKIKEKVDKLVVGDPFDEKTVIVPLISSASADFVEELIKDALDKGGKLLAGGKREGNMIYPTLIDHVTEEMRLAWEEPFGPVLPIIRVNDIDEAIRIANESEYGLQSSVFTKNIDKAFGIARRLEVGTVQINNKTERGPDHFPFLGVKSSGMGTQGIRYSIEAMTRPKATVLNLIDHI
ncbi:MAG: NADP-dependent glyceraldehyde-3-phosphate dehydrogenase [Zhenhengia sp.]|jgi:glyceraldehyde-3-phosphate dehydrogenase (NADP+)|uniref:NADP-dependent glyceraldehyde-3-phosphate dehydrogenase n=1 Tax=Zhenhengia sp. TaxID=2944208 RepID=UPI00291312DD|nr:NADP-dependent glyceraldehyde-3-phosphate dehydrogenase [Clostridiales bacterium]MDU6974053.1 NADP-dependent glyceraldehyde-3-phosphate dehydrogenase [Clostridiales bacterium]